VIVPAQLFFRDGGGSFRLKLKGGVGNDVTPLRERCLDITWVLGASSH
jgi:hypothetical protein